jgi:uncharacterized glyoxalase superfamily protein PhnB
MLAKQMPMDFKPEGYSSVSPYLLVDGADATIAFIKQVFDGKELRRFADATGHLRHAEVKIDDTVLMIADCCDETPAVTTHVHVYVRDVEETFRRAVEAGAVPVKEPLRNGDEHDLRGGVRQPGGVTWWIATKMS